jgi:hypothetical protein
MDAATLPPVIENRKNSGCTASRCRSSRIGSVKMEMSVLRENGILVDLTITGTSLFSRTASWFELGVMDAKTQDRFTKGRKSLIPIKSRSA